MQKILNAILLFPVFAFCQKPSTIDLIKDDAIINKWTHAVVNVETRIKNSNMAGSGDLMEIQDYLNNKLSGKTFGKSVRQFDFGYEIYDFRGYMKPWTQMYILIHRDHLF